MNIDWLVSGIGRQLISEARTITDPIRGITSLRKKYPAVEPQLISESLTQAQLQLRLEERWQVDASGLLLTEDGVMQATRPAAAKFRAELIASKFGTSIKVLDLTCGLGFDAMAMAKCGLQVTALERDPDLAKLANYNLRDLGAKVITTDCTTFVVPSDVDLIFVDPARRNPDSARMADGSSQRIFNPDDWSPSWSFVSELAQRFPVVAKVAPGFDASLVPEWDATWISVDGDLVETLLESQGSGLRSATLIESNTGKISIYGGGQITPPAEIGRYLVVPDAALIRASALTNLGDQVSGGLVNEHIAWLTSNDELAVRTLIAQSPRPAMGFEILKSIKYSQKALQVEVTGIAASGITVMTRGMQLDVESIRKSLSKSVAKGTAELVVAIYRDDAGPQALICRRLA